MYDVDIMKKQTNSQAEGTASAKCLNWEELKYVCGTNLS